MHRGIVKISSNDFLSFLQLCGNNPYVMTRCAQMLEEKTHIDFIDVNLGCPIELVYQQVQKAVSCYWISRIL
jgi:tRNA-dihydrouridine synthase 3